MNWNTTAIRPDAALSSPVPLDGPPHCHTPYPRGMPCPESDGPDPTRSLRHARRDRH